MRKLRRIEEITRIMFDIETSAKTRRKIKEDFVIKCLELLELLHIFIDQY